MFFLVKKYMSNVYKSYMTGDKIAVFDTDDCTVNLVTYEECCNYGIKLFNVIEVTNGVSVRTADFADMLYNETYFGHFFAFAAYSNDGSNVAYKIGDTCIRCDIDEKGILWVNGRRGLGGKVMPVYMFLYKCYVIIRCVEYYWGRLVTTTESWHTYAVHCKTGEVDYWNATLDESTNKKLAIEVDTLCEV